MWKCLSTEVTEYHQISPYRFQIYLTFMIVPIFVDMWCSREYSCPFMSNLFHFNLQKKKLKLEYDTESTFISLTIWCPMLSGMCFVYHWYIHLYFSLIILTIAYFISAQASSKHDDTGRICMCTISQCYSYALWYFGIKANLIHMDR